MTTQEKIKVYCYAQHCPGRTGGIVPVSEIEAWEGENPEKVEAGDYCDDWQLIAEGTEDEIVTHCREMIQSISGHNSNAEFSRRQHRNVLAMLGRPETPARMIDRNAWESDGRIEFKGDEFEVEELVLIEDCHPVADLTGWSPFTDVWRCGETEEEYTYYAVCVDNK